MCVNFGINAHLTKNDHPCPSPVIWHAIAFGDLPWCRLMSFLYCSRALRRQLSFIFRGLWTFWQQWSVVLAILVALWSLSLIGHHCHTAAVADTGYGGQSREYRVKPSLQVTRNLSLDFLTAEENIVSEEPTTVFLTITMFSSSMVPSFVLHCCDP